MRNADKYGGKARTKKCYSPIFLMIVPVKYVCYASFQEQAKGFTNKNKENGSMKKKSTKNDCRAMAVTMAAALVSGCSISSTETTGAAGTGTEHHRHRRLRNRCSCPG